MERRGTPGPAPADNEALNTGQPGVERFDEPVPAVAAYFESALIAKFYLAKETAGDFK